MYHIFFIHSSVDGYLDCFHVLPIANSAATNIGVHVSFSIVVFSGYMPSSGMCVSARSCPTLCSPMDYSPPDSSACGIFQARILVSSTTLGDFPDPGIKPTSLASPALAGGFFTSNATWEALFSWGAMRKKTSPEALKALTEKPSPSAHPLWAITSHVMTSFWTLSQQAPAALAHGNKERNLHSQVLFHRAKSRKWTSSVSCSWLASGCFIHKSW